MTGVLFFEHREGSATVGISRGPGVPDVLWLKVQTEWGTDGRSPGTGITAPVSVFLSRLDWLAPYCRQHGVRVEWRGTARGLVERHLSDSRLLDSALESLTLIGETEITGALAASRFARDLRSFQIRDLGRLLALANGANFSVPGAGKTSIAYAIYEYLRAAGTVERLLVVSPLSAFESWEEEALACFDPVPAIVRFDGNASNAAEVLLVNYHRLEIGFSEIATWVASQKTHVILDEAHRMKRGWSGEWGRNCLNLASLATRRDILTGTPAPQSVLDLEALFDFVWPGRARYLISRPSRGKPAVNEVSKSIAPLFVRTTKQELELPEPIVRTMSKPLDPLHGEIYAAILGSYRTSFPVSRRTGYELRHFGTVVMYLLEAATNPSLLISGSHPHDPILFRHPPLDVPEETDLDELLRAYPEYETPWKFRALRLAVEENTKQGRKTLVWSNFIRNLETLRHHELKEYNPAIVHGGIEGRENELLRFRSNADCHVLLANPAALGEGVSLHQVCHDAIYLERTFNAGHYLQSVDRIHRLGLQPNSVTRVTILASAGTIDQVVESRLREKTKRLGTLLQDPGLSVMSLPAIAEEGLEGDGGLGVDSSDLTEVARHLAE